MSNHKLTAGKQLIEGIARLGIVLGYHIEKEFPIDEPTYGEAPAVDVAWFSQNGNKFPLFIFEVESKATNGMTNNALKVYSQGNRHLEKPLFFFHVVVNGGKLSSRTRNLESMYGTHNYRVYLIGEDSATELIKNILEQHARVRNDIDYMALHQLLTSDLWFDKVEYKQLIMHATNLDLSKQDIIASYIKLTQNDQNLFSDLISLLRYEANHEFKNTAISSYLGGCWHAPIITSFLCGLSKDKEESYYWASRLIEWQKNGSYMPMITPSFGLSRDYDDFILGCAPQLLSLCMIASGFQCKLCEDLISILDGIIIKVGDSWIGLNTAIYLLHTSASTNNNYAYEKAKNYLIRYKFLSEDAIYNPTSCISIMDGGVDDYFQQGVITTIPDMEEFRKICIEKLSSNTIQIEHLVLRALDDDSYIYSWGKDLFTAIWTDKNIHKKRIASLV